ncbi:PA2G4 [Cordylochernes scorpioides]|uniref:PA2G4 n=1 Tax=Cordylochernes scorpioides TaxID=51811 RepID=A0ABY6KCI5_9ARAC|nr:PA2G4 [Cordylochernes scorpioides]
MSPGVLSQIIAQCLPGTSVVSLCELGDKLLQEETDKVFKKEKEIKKGISFPTCLSVNNCICHYSPLKSESDYTLKDGDMVKIDMGTHIDGFIAVVAQTLVVGASKENPVTGRKADLIRAAYTAAEAALRLVKPGLDNLTVTDTIQRVAEDYKCKPIEGMLSYQLKQFRLEGEKSIIQNPSEAQRKDHEKCQFEMYEVYAIDVLLSTGEGKGKEMDTRTTVYKKTNEIYNLKMKASRVFLSEVEKRFGKMPFTLRSFEDEKKAKMGVMECVNHKLVEPFQVFYEKEGEYVAQFKFTVLLMPSGSHKITLTTPPDLSVYQSDLQVQTEELRTLLSQPVGPKTAKKKKKKAATIVASMGDKDIIEKASE